MVDAGSTNTLIDRIFASVDDLLDGKMICGAGGGGFLQAVMKKGVTREQVRQRLQETFPNTDIDIWNCTIITKNSSAKRRKPMKLKEGFILRTVAGETVVIPSGEELDLNVMITLNETGAFLWERMQTETTQEALVEALLAEYDVAEQLAADCVAAFVKKLDENGFLAE